MTIFLRLLEDLEKHIGLSAAVNSFRLGELSHRIYHVSPSEFPKISSAPFAYWVSDEMRNTFQRMSSFEGEKRTAKQGLATSQEMTTNFRLPDDKDEQQALLHWSC
jgi:hypothetical protein